MEANQFKVGIFVTLGIVLVALSILLIGGDQIAFSKHYTLQVKLDSVQGLGPGSVVQLSGYKVGHVKNIEFAGDKNLLVVKMSIFTTYQSRIPDGSSAGVRTQGALGDKYIFITPGDLSRPPLQDGAELIPETGGDIFTQISKMGDDFKTVFDTVGEIYRFFKSLNANNRSGIMMENLSQSSEHLKKSLKDVDQTIVVLGSILKKVDDGQGTVGALINDPTIHQELKRLLGGSKRNKYIKSLIRETIDVDQEH